MVDDRDIWRAAKVLRRLGDQQGEVVWLRIRQYVRELQRTTPKGAVH